MKKFKDLINEISSKTLRSYAIKASHDTVKKLGRMYDSKTGERKLPPDEHNKLADKINRRADGAHRAYSKAFAVHESNSRGWDAKHHEQQAYNHTLEAGKHEKGSKKWHEHMAGRARANAAAAKIHSQWHADQGKKSAAENLMRDHHQYNHEADYHEGEAYGRD